MKRRRWLILIAVVAVTLVGWTLMERRRYYLDMAERNRSPEWLFSQRKQVFLKSGAPMINESFFDSNGEMKPEIVKLVQPRHEHYARLLRKYEYAAAHPWVRVEADPPAFGASSGSTASPR